MERECGERLQTIAEKFKSCRGALSALGDETRQLILLALLEGDYSCGLRVGEIAERIHLSRASASHHLRILKEAGIVNVRREGTKNYYYMDSRHSQWGALNELLGLVHDGIRHLEAVHEEQGGIL